MGETTYYVRLRGRVSGPFTVPQLQAMHQRGQFGRFHEVSRDRRSWAPASSLPELFPTSASIEDAPPTAIAAVPQVQTPESRPWYYLDAAGRQQGPVSWSELDQLRRDGDVADDTLVCSPGMSQWLTLHEAARDQPSPRARRRTGGSGVAGKPASDLENWEDRRGWRTLRTGLTLLLTGAFIWTGALVLLLFGVSVVSAGLSPTGVMLTAVLTAVLFLAARITDAVGTGFLAAAPPSCGARGVATASFILAVVGVVLSLLQPVGSFMVASVESLSPRAALEMSWGLALVLVSGLVFLLELARVLLLQQYLRGVCTDLAPALARVLRVLILVYAGSYLLAVLAGSFLAAVGLAADAGPTREGSVLLVLLLVLGIVLGLSAAGLFLFWLARYLVVLFQVRAAVSERLGPA